MDKELKKLIKLLKTQQNGTFRGVLESSLVRFNEAANNNAANNLTQASERQNMLFQQMMANTQKIIDGDD